MPHIGRPPNPDLHKFWKVSILATTAGAVELVLWDHIHNKPRKGARSRLIELLLQRWLEERTHGKPLTPLPDPELIEAMSDENAR